VRLKNTIIAIAGFMLVSALAYGELVLDWRTLHAEHQMKFALTSSAAFLMADYEQLKNEMKRKYGDRVGVSVPVTGYPAAQNGVAEVSLDGKVLENRSLRKLSDVYGLFIVDPDRAEPIRFPFRIAPDQNLANLDRSLVKTLTDHFKRVPQAWFEFSDTDWTIDQCSALSEICFVLRRARPALSGGTANVPVRSSYLSVGPTERPGCGHSARVCAAA
jgi:hypothetical protein